MSLWWKELEPFEVSEQASHPLSCSQWKMHVADSLFMRGASAFSFRARSSGQLSQIHCKPFKETWITLSKLWLQSVCDGGVLWLHAETRNRPHKGILIPKFCCSWSELEFRHSEILSYRTHNCRLSSIDPHHLLGPSVPR